MADLVGSENVKAARLLRRRLTATEARLWAELRGRRLDGFKFRRQQPVGSFVLDFYCHKAGLAIEVDGAVHDDPPQRERDAERQALIEAEGIRFLRVRAESVEVDLGAVLESIRAALTPRPPLPASPGEGECRSASK